MISDLPVRRSMPNERANRSLETHSRGVHGKSVSSGQTKLSSLFVHCIEAV